MSPLPTDFDTSTDLDRLNEYLAANGQTFRLIDEAVDQEFLVPPEALETVIESPDEVGAVRSLARLLMLRARVSDLEGRSDEASDALVKAVILGNRFADGGLLVHHLAANATQSIGLESLQQLAGKLSSEKQAEISAILKKEFAQQESVDSILSKVNQRELYHARQRLGMIAGSIAIWQSSELIDPSIDAAKASMERTRNSQQTLLGALKPNADAGTTSTE